MTVHVGDSASPNELKASFQTDSIDCSEENMVLRRTSVYHVLRRRLRSGRPVGWQDDEIRSANGKTTGCFRERGVVADQHSEAATFQRVHRELLVSRIYKVIDAQLGQMHFAVFGNNAFWSDAHCGVEDAFAIFFKHSEDEMDFQFSAGYCKLSCCGTRNFLCNWTSLFEGLKAVARQSALRKNHKNPVKRQEEMQLTCLIKTQQE